MFMFEAMSVEQDGKVRSSELALAKAENIFASLDVSKLGFITQEAFGEYLKDLSKSYKEPEQGLLEVHGPSIASHWLFDTTIDSDSFP